jgi:hypothetical protein
MNIQIIRGDTAKYKFQRINSEGVIKTEPRALYFTVKETANKERVVFQKTMEDMTIDEDGTWHFTIDPDDTNGKQYGDYVFDIEVIAMNMDKTTVAYGGFKIKPEVTWVQNEG